MFLCQFYGLILEVAMYIFAIPILLIGFAGRINIK
jgi:hypothetical protein